MGQNGVAAYASSKWAVRGLTRCAALELGQYGIRVNAVCPAAGSLEMIAPFMPPGVDVQIMANPRISKVLAAPPDSTYDDRIEDIARMIAFLASDDSVSCTGADFAVDGGISAGKLIKGAPSA